MEFPPPPGTKLTVLFPKEAGAAQEVGTMADEFIYPECSILERRKDVEQTVVCPRAGAMLLVG